MTVQSVNAVVFKQERRWNMRTVIIQSTSTVFDARLSRIRRITGAPVTTITIDRGLRAEVAKRFGLTDQ
ncbi:hypothetical protein TNCV_852891 [Trichonephila clavipes]|nr:hypothetical protein TNCV_852891 [Trichonephila clavipes]